MGQDRSNSYDIVSDLLTINNNISVASLIVTCVVGVLSVYGYYLTYRHQQWERRVQRMATVDSKGARTSYLCMLCLR